VRFLKQILNTGDVHGPIFCDSTRADKLTMTLKVEFLKYSINIHRVVKFVLKTVKSYKRDRQEKICIVNNKIKHILSEKQKQFSTLLFLFCYYSVVLKHKN